MLTLNEKLCYLKSFCFFSAEVKNCHVVVSGTNQGNFGTGSNQANFGAGLDQTSFGAGSSQTNFDNYGNPMQSDFGSPSQKIESLSINTPPKPHKPKKDGPMPEGFSKSEDGKIVCMHPGCGKTFTR